MQCHYPVTQSNGLVSIWAGRDRGCHKADLPVNWSHGLHFLHLFWGYRYTVEAINLFTSCSSLEFCYTLCSISKLYIIFSFFCLYYGCSDWRGALTVTLKEKKKCLMNQVLISWDAVIFFDIKPQATGGYAVGGGRWGGREKKKRVEETLQVPNHVQQRSKYNQAPPVRRQLSIISMAFWHWVVTMVTAWKEGGSQYVCNAMGIFFPTIPGCEINSEIKFHSLLPTTHSCHSSWTSTCTHVQKAHTFMFLHTVVRRWAK